MGVGRKVRAVVLGHGTGEKYAAAIEVQGVISKSRLYVHLSTDYETAVAVGRRHGRPVVYQIDTNTMTADGYVFYLSVNGVWLTKAVPAKYIKRVPDGKKLNDDRKNLLVKLAGSS